MKRLLCILVSLLVTAASAVSAMGQAQITTKKEKLKDFPTKITKVVMSGNSIQDDAIRGAVKGSWFISPYEFCSMDEFKALMSKDEFYFLVPLQLKYKGETKEGVTMLTLLRGDKGVKGMSDMITVAEMPMCSADAPFTASAFMPAVIDIIQSYVGNSLVSGFKGIGRQAQPLSKAGGKEAYVISDDLAADASDFAAKDESAFSRPKLHIVSPAQADSIMLSASPDAIVAYIVAPEEPEKGSVSYKMLIDARTHELYGFKKGKVSSAKDRGFTRKELLKISSSLDK